jgi:signal transduction histidine kinase
VVRSHGGSMSITQSPLGGARIQVTLPADEG